MSLLSDIEEMGFETVRHMQIAFMDAPNGKRREAVANVLTLEAPNVAYSIHNAIPDMPYNTCLTIAIETCAQLFERTIVGDR